MAEIKIRLEYETKFDIGDVVYIPNKYNNKGSKVRISAIDLSGDWFYRRNSEGERLQAAIKTVTQIGTDQTLGDAALAHYVVIMIDGWPEGNFSTQKHKPNEVFIFPQLVVDEVAEKVEEDGA